MNDDKVRAMAATFQALMNMSSKPLECGEELLGMIARDRSWTPEELAQLRRIVLPSSEGK